MTRDLPNVTEELERLIDTTSLQHVLKGLELVCAEKANINWFDQKLVRCWTYVSKVCGEAAGTVAVDVVSR